MTCLGYALLHPLQLERTLTASDLTLALDDGMDIALAAFGTGGLGAVGEAYQAELERQIGQVGAQFEALGAPGGPFPGLASLAAGLLDAELDLATLAERAADFLCDLQPVVVQGLLGGLVDQLDGALPVLDPTELATRARSLATAGLAVFEGRLLAGNTDMAAHRGYRAGAAIRWRVEPLLDRLDDALAAVDPFGAVRSLVDEVPAFDEQVVARLREGGCLLRDRVVPLFRCATTLSASLSVTVEAGGSEGQGPSPPALADEELPAPHAPGVIWAFDLVGSAVALGLVIYDSVRTSNPPRRFMQLVFTDVLRPIWVLFRLLARAFRWPFINGPPGDSDGDRRARGFVRFLFGDFGDFAMHFFLELLGSVHDMFVGWSNWISSIGLRIVKYYAYVVQPRTPYLFLRSVDWVKRWSESPARVELDDSAQAVARLSPALADDEPLVITVGGAAAVTVTFTAADNTPELIAARIDAVAGVQARVEDGKLIIETEATGRDAALVLGKGPATFPPTKVGIPIARFAWLVFGPAALGSWIMGLVFGGALWEQFHIEGTAFVGGVFGTLGPLALSYFFVPFAQSDGYHVLVPGDLSPDRGAAVVLLAAVAVVLFIATQTLVQSSPGALAIVLAILLPAAAAGFAIGSGFSDGVSQWSAYIVLLFAGWLMSGVMTLVVWWFILADGSDRKHVLSVLDPATSPYRLPFPAGEVWLCGQNSHGFFSHQMFDGDERNSGDHWSYDLNEAHGSTVLAARTGLVSRNADDIEDGDPDQPNVVQVQHLDWVEGHDPGWDLERGITYADYLHLAHRRTHVYRHQLVRQGMHIADSDDTGTSAMNHLHWEANSGQNADEGVINLPSKFREGKPNSFVFVESTNDPVDVAAVSPLDVDVPLGNAGDPDHGHTVRFTRGDLEADGSVPDGVTLTTEVSSAGPRHRHQLTLTRGQLQRLLRRDDPVDEGSVTTSTTNSHAHGTVQLPTEDVTEGGGTVGVAVPPPATLLARAPGSRDDDYQLLGHQMVLRVNGRATEWHSFGAHRARVAGQFTLDRGPAVGAGVEVEVNGTTTTRTPATVLMARAGARELATGQVAVRAEPVIVVETRMRGSAARLRMTGAAPTGLRDLTAALARGSGQVARLDDVGRMTFRNLVANALAAAAPPPPAVTAAITGANLDLAVAGQPVTSYANSTDRIAEVMGAVAPGGTLTNVAAVPITSGDLALTSGGGSFTAPIPGAPARVVIPGTDLGDARLAGDGVSAEPLVLRVRADNQRVRFPAGTAGAAALARRIMSDAEGVRAWADGSDLVIETVATGSAAALTLTKGTGGDAGTFPDVVPGTAPPEGGNPLYADSTSLSLAELKAAVDTAHAEAARPAAPAQVSLNGGNLNVQAVPDARVTITGSQALMGALNVSPRAGDVPGTSSVEGNPTATITGLADRLSLPTPGWLVVAIDGAAGGPWRVDITAEPARLELAAPGLPREGEELTLSVNGTAVAVPFEAGHVGSLSAVAARIEERVAAAGADGGVTARIAYRYAFESAAHGGIDIEIGGAASPGGPSAGFVVAAEGTGRGQVDDATAVLDTGLDPAELDGRLVRAFSMDGTPAAFVATAGGDVAVGAQESVGPLDVDPFGVVGSPAPPLADTTVDLGRESVGYAVTASGTTTTVEFNAAPAHLHSAEALAPHPDSLGAAGPLPLVVTVTSPAGTAASATVDLGQVADETGTAAEAGAAAAALIQREAPLVRCWQAGNRILFDTRGGGTAWQLRLEGEPALLALGFDPAAIDDSGGITATGAGNVRDGAAVTFEEARDIFDTMGGLATVDAAAEYIVTRPAGGVVRLSSGQGPVTITSEPGALAAALVTTATPDGLEIATPAALDNGWLFVQVAGRHAGSCAVWGRSAAIEAADPLPDDLTTLSAGATLRLTVDGSFFPATSTMPAGGFGSPADLIRHLNRELDAQRAWIGLVRRGGGDHLRIESRIRGTDSAVRLVVSEAMLGFPAGTIEAVRPEERPGGGTVDRLASVSDTELESILQDGRGFARTAQDTVEAVEDGTVLRVLAVAGNTTQLTAPVDPDGLAAPAPQPRQDVIEYPFAAPLDTGPHLTELETDAPAPAAAERDIQALLLAEPARVGPMTVPAALSDLDGTTLRLTAATTTATITFTGVTGPGDVIDQIQRGASHLVRAGIGPAGLVIESFAAGTAASLSVVTDPTVSTAFVHLGAPPAPGGFGSGNVADAGRVTAAEYATIINGGFLRTDVPRDRSAADMVRIGARDHLVLTSTRRGCDSALQLLPVDPGASAFAQTLVAPPLDFDLGLSRGPAARASVALAPFVDGGGSPTSRTLNGDLVIRFNDNAAPDLPPATDVRVTFAGDLTAGQAAAAIDAALAAAGAGAAAAYPDQAIVIESATPGLAGTVTVPSPAGGSTAGVVTALGLDPPLTNRGWPGAGNANLRFGYRGYAGNARADTRWQFAITGSTSPPITVTAGDTPATVAAAVDAALRAPVGGGGGGPAPNRMGLAAVGDDGALYVELFRDTTATPPPEGLQVEIDGTFQAPAPVLVEDDEFVIWLGGDTGVEPAFELRRTDVLRTFRMVYFDRRGDHQLFFDPALLDPSPAPDPGSAEQRVFDVGWVRPPTTLAAVLSPVQRWMAGRWLLAARAEGARSDSVADGTRTRAYAPAAEMVVSGGTAAVGGRDAHFVRQARYWVMLGGAATATALRVVRIGDDFLVDHLVL